MRRIEGKTRLQKLKEVMEQEHLELLAITNPSHNKWLIGTPFVICTIVPFDGLPMVFHHPMEYQQVKDHIWLDHEEEMANLLDRDLVHNLWTHKMKVSSWMDLVQKKTLKKYHKKASIDQAAVWKARSTKTKMELERIKTSCEICKQMMREALSSLNLGDAGKEVQAKIMARGSEIISNKRSQVELLYPHAHPNGFYHEFDVLSGKETAYPHAETTERKIRKNEPIALSCAVKFDEYWAEFGITTFLGKLNEEENMYMLITEEAHKAAVDQCRIDTEVYLIDKAAREVFDSHGLWNFCNGSVGHSMGLENHELPSIWPPIGNFLSEELIRKDQVFSIEPGLWIQPKYGFLWKTMIRVSEENQIIADPFQL